jgi:hypothetical protein
MATPRTTPWVKESGKDPTAAGGGGIRPKYAETFGVNVTGMSAGRKIEPGQFGGGPATQGLTIPGDEHPTQPSIGSRAGSR